MKKEIMAINDISKLKDLRFGYIKQYQRTKYRSAQKAYMNIVHMLEDRINELTK